MLIVAFPRRLKFINPEFPSALHQIPECGDGEEMPDTGLDKGREGKAALAPTSFPLCSWDPSAWPQQELSRSVLSSPTHATVSP